MKKLILFLFASVLLECTGTGTKPYEVELEYTIYQSSDTIHETFRDIIEIWGGDSDNLNWILEREDQDRDYRTLWVGQIHRGERGTEFVKYRRIRNISDSSYVEVGDLKVKK